VVSYLVSIIIPTKNRESTTLRALNSCLNQTYKNIEIVIVDDGSALGRRPESWLHNVDLKNHNVKIVQIENSMGGGYARNVGVDVCSGEFVTFLDSDDIYLTKTIEKQVSKHLAYNGDIITYGQALRAIYRGNEPYSELEVVPLSAMSDELSVGTYLFLQNGRIFTPTLFMRRRVFDNIKFDHRLKRHQDYGFVLKAEALNYQFVFIDEILFKWISDELSETSQEKKIALDISLDFLSYYSHLLTNDEIRAYILKVAAPIAVKNLSFINYYKLLTKTINQKNNLFFIYSILSGFIRIVQAKLRFIF